MLKLQVKVVYIYIIKLQVKVVYIYIIKLQAKVVYIYIINRGCDNDKCASKRKTEYT